VNQTRKKKITSNSILKALADSLMFCPSRQQSSPQAVLTLFGRESIEKTRKRGDLKVEQKTQGGWLW
jgi:hypothetical protein